MRMKTVFENECNKCHQTGFINASESEDRKLVDAEEKLSDQTHGEWTILICVHCRTTRQHNVRYPIQQGY